MSRPSPEAIRSATSAALDATSGFTSDFEAYLESLDNPPNPIAQPEAAPPSTKPSTAITATSGPLTPVQKYIDANILRFHIVEMEPYDDVADMSRGVFVEFGDEVKTGRREYLISAALKEAEGVGIINCESNHHDKKFVEYIVMGKKDQKFDRFAGCSVNG